jgi:DNA topoisomerase I
MALQELSPFESPTQAKRNLLQAVERVAERLGNTPTICRKCYIHPAVIDSYLEGSMRTALKRRAETALSQDLRALRPQEAAVLGLLQQRLQRAAA